MANENTDESRTDQRTALLILFRFDVHSAVNGILVVSKKELFGTIRGERVLFRTWPIPSAAENRYSTRTEAFPLVSQQRCWHPGRKRF